MYLLIVDYSQPAVDVALHKEAHKQWIEQHVEDGVICAGGAMKNQAGGVLLARTMDKTALRDLIATDPYVIADVADYRIIDFSCKITSTPLESLKIL